MQQFLYTFRYFCTPHDFLHFLLDRINSTLSRYAATSAPRPRPAGGDTATGQTPGHLLRL